MFKDNIIFSKENKRLIFGISFAILFCLSYLAIASYMKSPENLNYPNPGHHPGEIGPGTFNVCNESEPFWMFPADKLGGLGFKIINGSGEFYNGLKVEDSSYDPDFIVYGNSQLGNDSSDKTTVKGDLDVSGNISANNYPPQACGAGYSIRQINPDGSVVCELDDTGITSESDPLSVHKTGGNITGDLNISGGLVVGNPTSGNKGAGSINAQHIYVNGSEVSSSTCSCEGTGWEVKNRSGDIVYVDCNADKCWTPTAASTYTWGPDNDESDNSCIGKGSNYSACNYCDNLDYGGFTDWVLPDKTTLQNLCNSDSCSETCFGGDGSLGRYWSSTEYSASDAYGVLFTACDVNYHGLKSYDSYVRCVRG